MGIERELQIANSRQSVVCFFFISGCACAVSGLMAEPPPISVVDRESCRYGKSLRLLALTEYGSCFGGLCEACAAVQSDPEGHSELVVP